MFFRKVTDGQSAAGQSGKRQSERVYLGAVEIYREFAADGLTVTLERETLHVDAGQNPIALIETRTTGTDRAPTQLVRYQFTNHLASTVLELDDQAQIISYEEYFPYGSTSYQAVRSQTDTPKRYRYTGKERDEESDLYYHSARYYAPWLGRWTSADPAGTVDSTNTYSYARNKPIRLSDPAGTQAILPEEEEAQASLPELHSTAREEAELTSIPEEHRITTQVANGSAGYSPNPQPPTAEQLSSSAMTPPPTTPLERWIENMLKEDQVPGIYQGEEETYEERVTKPARVAAADARAYPGLAKYIEGAERQEAFIKAAPFLLGGVEALARTAIGESGAAALEVTSTDTTLAQAKATPPETLDVSKVVPPQELHLLKKSGTIGLPGGTTFVTRPYELSDVTGFEEVQRKLTLDYPGSTFKSSAIEFQFQAPNENIVVPDPNPKTPGFPSGTGFTHGGAIEYKIPSQPLSAIEGFRLLMPGYVGPLQRFNPFLPR